MALALSVIKFLINNNKIKDKMSLGASTKCEQISYLESESTLPDHPAIKGLSVKESHKSPMNYQDGNVKARLVS